VGALKPEDTRRLSNSDLIGVSTTTSTAPEAYRLADGFRRLGKPAVIGGVHASFMPEEALEHADFVVRGEAESSFPQLLARLESGAEPIDVPGISFRRGDQIVHNPDAPLIADLDGIPFPDFSLISSDLRLFDVPVQTSRGCPFPCNFCSVTKMFGRKVRYRSVESVLEELKQIPKPSVFFYDDNFCARPAFTKQLLESLLVQGSKLQYFSAQVRADMTRDAELMRLFYAAGGRQVYVGFESINPESLKAYDKRQTLEEIVSSMEVFRRFKIRVHGMFIIGSEYDTPRTARETLRFARRHGIDTIQFMMLTPLPGTELFQELDAQGRILSRDWSLYDAHHAVFLPARMTPLQLQKSSIRGMSQFYTGRRGLQELARLNLFRASRALMGMYIIRRWKWENRGWTKELRRLSLLARRMLLQKRLEELEQQLRTALGQVPGQLDIIQRRAENLLKQMEHLAQRLMAALDKEIQMLEQKVQSLSREVRRILDEIQGSNARTES
jgi:radical SAM superfamily enzyme YgiQ (UPF0313 family)